MQAQRWEAGRVKRKEKSLGGNHDGFLGKTDAGKFHMQDAANMAEPLLSPHRLFPIQC